MLSWSGLSFRFLGLWISSFHAGFGLSRLLVRSWCLAHAANPKPQPCTHLAGAVSGHARLTAAPRPALRPSCHAKAGAQHTCPDRPVDDTSDDHMAW